MTAPARIALAAGANRRIASKSMTPWQSPNKSIDV
jgi:hypothetical protein